MSFDGTFNVANITPGNGKVLVIAMGELGHIVGYVLVHSESLSNLLRFWSA